MLIEDGRIHFDRGFDAYVEQVLVPRAARLGVVLSAEIDPGSPVAAEVNHNRWIARCPDCGVAAFVWLEAPLLMCDNCWNGTAGHRWRRVALPREQLLIEAALMRRPIPQNRNWLPAESVVDLVRENVAHGLGG